MTSVFGSATVGSGRRYRHAMALHLDCQDVTIKSSDPSDPNDSKRPGACVGPGSLIGACVGSGSLTYRGAVSLLHSRRATNVAATRHDARRQPCTAVLVCDTPRQGQGLRRK